jgi:uncharacterized protein YjbI with pentapeptide repeats
MEQSELKETLEQHKLWIKTNGAKGQRANLCGANLTGAKLQGAKLTGADFRYVDLRGADLTGANLHGVDLRGADLTGADLTGAYLEGAYLHGAIGLPHVSWIIPGCMAQLNEINSYGFFLGKERKYDNFIEGSLGFFIQDNWEEKTFDILVGDRIIRNIPDWVKYSGIKQVALVSV